MNDNKNNKNDDKKSNGNNYYNNNNNNNKYNNNNKNSNINGEKKYIPRSKRKTKYGRRTRSRQKNIKKDTRPIDQRPTYLTKGATDYNPNEPRWKHRVNKDGVKAVKLKNGWVMQDKNAAILKKNNKEKKDAKETKTANHDVSKETEKTVEKKKKKKKNEQKGKEIGGMTMDDETFFNDSSNQNW